MEEIEKMDVIAVLGLSFSGSTLLNTILGAHPDIAGAGELFMLLARRREELFHTEIKCNRCSGGCAFWTEELIYGLSADALYRRISKVFDKSILCDSSKAWQWFDFIQMFTDKAVRFTYVVIVKHPIRHLASWLLNSGGDIFADKREMLLNLADMFERFYFRLSLYIQRQKDMGNKVFCLRYEDIVSNPQETLTPVLNTLQLEYVPAMDKCFEVAHHQIGGNDGTFFSTSKKWIKETNSIKKNYYEKKNGIFLDDKYKLIFSEGDVIDLYNDKRIKALMEQYCYEPLVLNKEEKPVLPLDGRVS